jgi:hypothetical protein
MAYPLSSPIDISGENPVSLTLTNTSSSVVWSERTDANDNLIFGTANPGSTDILMIKPDSGADPAGTIEVPKIGITNGTNKVNFIADPAASMSYDYCFPPDAPSDGKIIVSFGVPASKFVDLNPTNTLRVRKNPAPTEFTSIVAAIASIPVSPALNFPDFDNPWVIKIAAGSYTENAIVVPPYVYLVGDSMESVSVYQNGTGFPLFKMNAPSGLAFMGIGYTDPLYPAIDCDNCGDFLILHKITVVEDVEKFLSCVTDNTATSDSVVYLEYVDTTASTSYSILCKDTNTAGGFGSTISAENFFTFEHNNDSIIVDGVNSSLLIHAVELGGDGSGNAIRIKNGSSCDIRSTTIMGYTNGILVDNDGSTPQLITDGITYRDCTVNINILNPLTTGNSTGYTEYLKTIVPRLAPFFITGKNHQIITVGQKGSDFTSVVAALASITDNSTANRYTIYISPGVYIETQIVLKPFVSLVGFFQTTCILLAHPSVQGTPFIIGAGYSAIDKLTISTASYLTPPSYLVQFTGDPTGVHFRCDNIVLDNSADLMYIGSSSGPCIFLLLNALLNMSAPFVNGVLIDDAGPSNFPIIFTIDNLIWGADLTGVSALNEIITIRSYKTPSPGVQNIFGAITGCSMGTNFYGPAGIGFTVQGAVYIVIETCIFGGMNKGVQVLPSAEGTFMILTSCTISNNICDIDIQSATAFGTVNTNATLSKVLINDSADFGVQINDEKGSMAFGGDLFQGIKWSEITNISEQIQHASTTGIIDGQTSITDAGGLNVSIAEGSGYVFFGPLAGNRLKYVQWSANATFALTDNILNWIFIDQTGTISKSTSRPDGIENIILGSAKTYSGLITYIQEIGHVLNNLSSNIDELLRETYGPIVKSGCITTPGSNAGERSAQVSSGSYSLGVSKYPPTGGDNVSIIGYYGGTVETTSFTNIPLQYDNAGVLTNIPVGQWAKHSLYIMSSLSATTQYFMVYGQELFATELAAQDGPTPTPPSSFIGNMCPTSGIIVTDSDPSSPLSTDRFRDIRPTLGFRSEGTTASADHNSLLNLTVGNAHPQYFRVDGTSTLTGNINLGGNNIAGTGGNLLNGVDIVAHASRHLPGGADALATGTSVSVGSANSSGSASSFSRSDHVHAGVTSIAGTTNQLSTTAAQGALTLSTPSTFIAPGTIQDTTGIYYSTATGISASGSTQGDATVITKSYNEVATVPPSTGVRLSIPSTGGLRMIVVNRGANTLCVYPEVGGKIDNAAVNTFVDIPAGTSVTYQAATTTQWYTVKDAIVSGTGTTITYDNGKTIVNASGVSTFSGDSTGLTPAVPTTGDIVLSGILNPANGGTGVNSSSAANGELLIGNGSGLELATLSFGTGINVANSSGGITLDNTGVTSLSGGSTGLTPSTPATGAIVLDGKLNTGFGGTGLASYSVGDLLYASGGTALSKLTSPATGNVLLSGGIFTAPLWGKVGLATHVSGVLATVNGGTGQSSYTIGDLLYASGGAALSKLPAVATGNALISGVTPSWGKIDLATTVSGTLQAAQAPAFSGNVTSAAGSLSLTIANNAVTNARLSTMVANTIKGNNTGGLLNPLDLSPAQVTAMLNTFTSGLKGLTPASGGGVANFLRADGAWSNPVSSMVGGVNTNVQYNNAGSLGGNNAFNFVNGVNPVVNISGTNATTQLTVGGTTLTNNAALYVEVTSAGSGVEGIRTYFNRGPGLSSFITYDYDGAAPNLRLTDEDNDSPYVQFNVVGSGTYQAPQYNNVFGGRGSPSNATTGFSWKVNGSEISTMDSQFFVPPSGTTAQRPSPTVGMVRYNSSTGKPEVYVPNVWASVSGIIDKSVASQMIVGSAGITNIVSYVVPGGTLGTGNIIRLKTSGRWDATSNNKTFTLRISYGGVILWQDVCGTQASNSQSGWEIAFDIFANQSTTSQLLNGHVVVGRGGNPDVGEGGINTDEITANGVIYGTSTVNSTLDQTLVASIEPNGNTQTFTKNMHTIELL